jgi:hypothetical protein
MADDQQRRNGKGTIHNEYAVVDPEFKWSSWSSWPLSLRFSPAFLALLGLFVSIYYQHFIAETTAYETCVASFDYGFPIKAVRHQAENLASHSWEYGTAAEAIMELVNPERSVFGIDPFPGDRVQPQGWKMDEAMVWVYQHIDTKNATLYGRDAVGVSDPASLGVAATMVGQRWSEYLDAAERQKNFLLQDAPRYINGAISHRTDAAELWSDAIFMFPPFLAYYGVHKKDMALLRAAVKQIQLYRDALSISEGSKKGLWKHIASPTDRADDGAWSTGNGWAAHGMARVRATITGWRPGNETMRAEIDKLDRWITEILDAAIRTDDDEGGLLRNYLGQDSW